MRLQALLLITRRALLVTGAGNGTHTCSDCASSAIRSRRATSSGCIRTRSYSPISAISSGTCWVLQDRERRADDIRRRLGDLPPGRGR